MKRQDALSRILRRSRALSVTRSRFTREKEIFKENTLVFCDFTRVESNVSEAFFLTVKIAVSGLPPTLSRWKRLLHFSFKF